MNEVLNNQFFLEDLNLFDPFSVCTNANRSNVNDIIKFVYFIQRDRILKYICAPKIMQSTNRKLSSFFCLLFHVLFLVLLKNEFNIDEKLFVSNHQRKLFVSSRQTFLVVKRAHRLFFVPHIESYSFSR